MRNFDNLRNYFENFAENVTTTAVKQTAIDDGKLCFAASLVSNVLDMGCDMIIIKLFVSGYNI